MVVRKILLVDDASFIRSTVKNTLVSAGHIVVGEASNGYEAIEQYKALLPDVVFMDITMPEMSGIEAVAKIKAFDQKAQIIMCSGLGLQSMKEESLSAGAIDFIVKPFNSATLISALLKVK